MSAATLVVPVEEPSQVGEARRLARGLAGVAGGADPGVCALVATELATNLSRHASRGVLVLQRAGEAVQLLALDRGPGIANVAACMRDGYSGSSSPGTGLGAIRRAATAFDVYSRPGVGTAVAAVVGPEPMRSAAPRTEHAALTVPLAGQPVCGDGWALVEERDATWALLADGLGHGPAAAEASDAAVDAFAPTGGPAAAVDRLHAALRSTRGAAVAVARIDPGRQSLRFAGAGNVAAAVVRPGGMQRLASHNGTAGVAIGRVVEYEAAWTPESVLVLHSDGLRSNWGAEDFPGLFSHRPAVVAGVLYRDLARGTDDAGLLVLRERT